MFWPPKKPMFSHDFHQIPGVQVAELSFLSNGQVVDLTSAVASNEGGSSPSTKVRIFYGGFHDDFIGSNGT